MPLHDMEGPVPGPKAGGRKTALLTSELQDEIVKHLASGAFFDEVCRAVGLGRSTFWNWRDRGRRAKDRAEEGNTLDADEVTYMDFFMATEKARGMGTVLAHATIRKNFDKHWQAAAWYLERTNPRRYARRTWTEDEAPTGEELEDVPVPEEADEGAELEAVITFAKRWAEERDRRAS